MKILHFNLSVYDDKNLKLTKSVKRIAKMDFKDSNGNVTIAKGTEYDSEDELGFFQTPEGAFRAMLAHEAVKAFEAETLTDALERIERAKNDLRSALEIAVGVETAEPTDFDAPGGYTAADAARDGIPVEGER
jgi:hypothetical protein